MGGHDVYSMSKGAAELVTASWRRSFFHPQRLAQHGVAVATARAGNVVGGGDWAQDRIVPDAIAALSAGQAIPVRNPRRRPAVAARARAARRLPPARRPARSASRPRPSPRPGTSGRARRTPDRCATWSRPSSRPGARAAGRTGTIRARPHEAGLLRLSIDKATARLGWTPRWHFDETFRRTVGVVPRLPRGRVRRRPGRAVPNADPRVPGVLTRMDHKAEERRLTAEIVERARQIARLAPAGGGGRRVHPREDAGPLRAAGSTARRSWPTSPRAPSSSGSPAGAGTPASRAAWPSGTASPTRGSSTRAPRPTCWRWPRSPRTCSATGGSSPATR